MSCEGSEGVGLGVGSGGGGEGRGAVGVPCSMFACMPPPAADCQMPLLPGLQCMQQLDGGRLRSRRGRSEPCRHHRGAGPCCAMQHRHGRDARLLLPAHAAPACPPLSRIQCSNAATPAGRPCRPAPPSSRQRDDRSDEWADERDAGMPGEEADVSLAAFAKWECSARARLLHACPLSCCVSLCQIIRGNQSASDPVEVVGGHPALPPLHNAHPQHAQD